MIVKFVNPVTQMLQLSEFNNVQIDKVIDEEGNTTKDFCLLFNLKDLLETILVAKVGSFTECSEILNSIYDAGKLDLSTNAHIDLKLYMSAINSMTDDTDVSDMMDALFDELGFDNDDIDYIDGEED